jgi:prepilin-type N-terminal cleavage/methylation domain-containing protein
MDSTQSIGVITMKKTKNGFTLIELLVVMSVGSLLMGLAIQVLERAMTISTNTAEQLDEARNVNRLADQFRRDIHLANDVDLETPEQLIVNLDGEAITYTFLEQSVNRVGVASDGITRREQFALGDRRSVTFSEMSAPDRVSLSVLFDTRLKHLPKRTDRVVVAVLGNRRRLTPPRVTDEQVAELQLDNEQGAAP